MSKVYEAMQRVYVERRPVAQLRKGASIGISTSNRIGTAVLPPRRMEREMMRLHQSVTTLLPQFPKPIIQFIGARQGEGTSTLVWEYGCVMAKKMNKSVLIVDGDTNTIPHHQALGIQPTIFLQELLRDEKYLNGSISKFKDLSLYICGLGNDDQLNTQGDLLGNIGVNWKKIRARFDCVLIDSPPMSLWGDALNFCSIVDGVVIVVEAEVSRAPVVHSLKDHIVKSGGNILGVVFNKQRHYIPPSIYKWL